ncbi:MAG: hypothetical protein OXH08_01680 [Gammaproteobacteria bacterium]|nr:hypothetical protein [Gammaproteobacteria bacterium]MDE0649090.1 hypothetical protein [Gammaproteobacteria bacterium]
MPVTSCDYLLFDQRYNQGNLRDVLRHVLPELNRMNPAGLRKCAASGRFRWLIWRDGKRFHLKQSYRDVLQLAPDLWANVRWVTRGNLQASCRAVIEQRGYPGASFEVIGFGDNASGRTTAEEPVTVEGSTPEAPRLSRGVHGSTDLAEGLVAKLEARYAEFLEDMGVDPATGLLKGREAWKIACYPYVGTKYGSDPEVNRVLVFGLNVGYDMNPDGIWTTDEWREGLEPQEKVRTGFNPHIAGTYFTMLRYGCPPEWGWERFRNSRDSCQVLLRKDEGLPSENPLSYLAFSNIYKWAWHGAENTLQQKSTQKFLDRTKEVALILDEVRILDPDIVVLQGSRFAHHSFGPVMNEIDRLTGKAYVLVHPSHRGARHPERITRPLPYAAPAGRYGV